MAENRKVDTTEIDARIEAARADLRRLEGEKHRMLLKPWGIDIGDRVKCRRTGKLGTIESIDTHGMVSRPWLCAFMDRKDGTPSAVVKCLYGDWEPVDPTPSTQPVCNGGRS